MSVRMFQDDLYAFPETDGDARLYAKDAAAGAKPAKAQPVAAGRDDFGKLFDLPFFGKGQDVNDLKQRLRGLSALKGPMDADDPLVTTTNPLDGNERNNPDNRNRDMTVGFTFLGQFIDHDLTFDPTPPADKPPQDQINFRSPRFDLDSVYLRGPMVDFHLYDGNRDKPKFLIDAAAPRDLPRRADLQAIIGDPRNDENVIISQLHLAFLKFHNQAIDWLHKENQRLKGMALFERARQLTQWHYQYIVVEQFLSVTLDEDVFDDVHKNGPKYFKKGCNKIPREFQVAAYRFGHSQVRPGYKINGGFGAPIFDNALQASDSDPNDLRGQRRSPRRFVEWDTFFDFGTEEVVSKGLKIVARPKVKSNKRIDPRISTAMLKLPVGEPGTPASGEEDNLATRNLFRHLQFGLPSGQAVASLLKKDGLLSGEPLEFPDLKALKFHDNTPLWYYILGEAKKQKRGKRLGTVGSRIVAEVFFGLLASDPNSYWSKDKNFTSDLPANRNPNYKPNSHLPFTMTDFLSFARVA